MPTILTGPPPRKTIAKLRAVQRTARPGQPPPRGRRTDDKLIKILSFILAVLLITFGVMFMGTKTGGARRLAETGRAALPIEPTPPAELEGAQAEAPEPPLPPDPLLSVETDPTGRLLQVSGTSPQSVLEAYCQQRSATQALEPVGLVESVPANTGVRIGLFRDLDRWDQPVRAIRIRRDPRVRLWVAGDGRAPIRVEDPPSTIAPPPELAALAVTSGEKPPAQPAGSSTADRAAASAGGN